ncbi:alpha/beta fold hydrolase [Auraticoccus monumenti]|uniref:alpha/beta fold hydrolase n=1 Tax=Auraticoccus monumenti TaxID=675864 RepID=UPI000B810030|nr:alpha/beta fold hydrolase [Auraticoccus monumenti]
MPTHAPEPDWPADLDPRWSRRLTAPDAEGVPRRWHLLDTAADRAPEEVAELPTLLCLHGNPTWSYLWRRLLATCPEGWRVIAPDQLGMGFSEPAAGSLASPRRLAQRVEDLSRLTEALGLRGPVVAVGHDWGGPVVSGWAVSHAGLLAGIVLANTAVFQDPEVTFSGLIRLARTPGLLETVCVRTPTFLHGATALSRPPLPKQVRDGLLRPYRRAADRGRIGQFVADVPLEPDHPTRATLDAVAEGVAGLDVPALLLRGTRDPVFTEAHLRDLMTRLPQADVHRYEGASHLVTEDRPQYAATVWQWVGLQPALPPTGPGQPSGSDQPDPSQGPEGDVEPSSHADQAVGDAAASGVGARPPWWRQSARADDPTTAVVEMATGRTTSFAELEADVVAVARGLLSIGVRPGQRVATLVTPGIDLTVLVYACWRIGAVIVVADAGLGVRSLGRALRGAGPDVVVGIPVALAATRAMRVPGRRVVAGELPARVRKALAVEHDLDSLRELGRTSTLDIEEARRSVLDADGDADCAVLFTSGATGPSKGVVYRLSQLSAQLEVLRETMGFGPDSRFVAAFAPFALYGPALGVPASVPDMDVTAPGTLTAGTLADAVARLEATVVFASPAALASVVATADALDDDQRRALAGVRRLMSAGAPVPAGLLRRLSAVVPAAELHTPYGMTEALPLTDITLDEIDEVGAGEGVCVGRPRPGVTMRVAPLPRTPDGEDGDPVDTPGVTGELWVTAAHVKERYDRLWATQHEATPGPRWHRTGDVGHLDEQGRVWVEGRRVHVVHGPDGPVTPVGIEQRVETLDDVRQACVAGVGPAGTQQVVVVLVPEPGVAVDGVVAPPGLAAEVRRVAGTDIAAVLCAPALPVDIRHQSKIDRTAVSRWADRVLAGRRPGRLARPPRPRKRSR